MELVNKINAIIKSMSFKDATPYAYIDDMGRVVVTSEDNLDGPTSTDEIVNASDETIQTWLREGWA